MTSNWLLRHICMAFLLLAAGTGLLAQTDAEIGGTITDPSGAVIPGVSVTVTNVDTGVARATVSNELGFFIVPLLQPGNYQIELTSEGFRPIMRTGLTLHVNEQARIEFTMEVGAVTEQVTVTADTPLLETATATRGQVIDNQKIVDLPLNGRDYLQLALISAVTRQPPCWKL